MNNSVKYATGDWFLVARENGLVLLPPTVPVALLEQVWHTLQEGELAHVIDALTQAYGKSLSSIPPFAAAIVDEDDLRIAVRGGVRVAYDDGSRQDLITGGRVQTWVEQAIPTYSTLVVTPPDAELGELMLPVASGVVRTGLVSIGDTTGKSEATENRRSRRRQAEEAGTEGDDFDDVGDAEGNAPAGEDDADGEAEVTPAAAPVNDAPADDEADAEPKIEVAAKGATSAAPVVVEETEVEAPTEGEAEVDAEAEVEAEAEAEGEAPAEAEAEAETSIEEPEAEAVIEAEAEAETEAEAAAEVDESELSDVQVDRAFAAITDQQRDAVAVEHFSDHDGMTLDHAAISTALAEGAPSENSEAEAEAFDEEFVGRAVLSTGRAFALDRVLVLGRRPRVTRTTSGAVPALVTVDSPTHDISRNHVEIRREGDMVLVTDLNTTNGTVLLRGDEAPQRLHPGEATLVVNGDIIDIGDEVTVTFEDLP